MRDVVPFAFDEHLVRVILRNADPWFVAEDVGRALGIAKVRNTVAGFDDDERAAHSVGTLGGEQKATVLSEPGLYRLIFMSRKPDARRFQRWVTHEVLPTIRKTGSYGAADVERSRSEPTPESQIYRLNLVREARLLFGADRARGLWSQLGLPIVPAAPNVHQDEAHACLVRLLDHRPDGAGGASVRDLLDELLGGEDQYERLLATTLGVKCDVERDAFIVANIDDGLSKLYAATEWRLGRWSRVLRRLPGALPSSPMRFGGVQRRGTLIPSDYLDRIAVGRPTA